MVPIDTLAANAILGLLGQTLRQSRNPNASPVMNCVRYTLIYTRESANSANACLSVALWHGTRWWRAPGTEVVPRPRVTGAGSGRAAVSQFRLCKWVVRGHGGR